ncbi:MAG TPA: alpha/beta hydrolase [Comamonadaceae bacterium]|nr:alpha/beta hydrolase [Comamonadaceae bacterium]
MPALHFVQQGQGPVVVLSHALGCDLQMWDGVAAALQDRYTVLRYDHRGHGQSLATGGAFTMDDLADDAAELIRQQGCGPVHFVGLSMGGMTAQALAARHPALVRSITIANSASHYDAAAQVAWAARVSTVLAQGMESIADGALQRWFTPEFRADAHGSARVAALRAVLVGTAPAPYAAACEAVANIDLEAGNRRITCPALVIAGTRDEATPPAMSEAIARSITGAELASLDAAHLSAVEQPQAFADTVARFLQRL